MRYIITSLLAALIASCSQETIIPQKGISFKANDFEIKKLYDLLDKELSKDNFKIKSSTLESNKILTKRNSGSLYFESEKGDTVSIINLIDPSCFNVSVYSVDGKEDAIHLVDKLKKIIDIKVKNIKMFERLNCKE